MAGGDRMTIEEVVRRVLREEHADVINALSRHSDLLPRPPLPSQKHRLP